MSTKKLYSVQIIPALNLYDSLLPSGSWTDLGSRTDGHTELITVNQLGLDILKLTLDEEDLEIEVILEYTQSTVTVTPPK